MDIKRLFKSLKPLIPVILFSLGLLIFSFSTGQSMNEGISEHGKVLFSTVAKIGRELEKKYGMASFGGGGGAGPDGIRLMSLSLNRVDRGSLNEEEARKLIIECVDDFLKAVNNNEQLRPFLRDYPFTAKNIELDIYNIDKNQELFQFPSIAIVANFEGKIGFLTEDPSTKHGYHTKKYETYDEAVALLKKQAG